MKKEKGFTLIEVIIALAIMASVVLIGYQAIDKTHGLSEEQALTANIQNGVNNLKVYITKELSSAKDVELSYGNNKGGNIDDIEKRKEDYMNISDQISNLSVGKKFVYKYILHLNEKDLIEYEIEVHKYKGKCVFDINRTDRNVKINLIENQPLTNNLIPMKINIKNDNIYDVELNYIKQKTKIYSFDVYSRLNNKSTDKPPIDPPTYVDNGYFGYCISESIDSILEAGVDDNQVNKVLKDLNSILNGDIRKEKKEILKTLSQVENKLRVIIENSGHFTNGNYYDALNRSLYYVNTAKEILNVLDVDQEVNKAYNLAANTKDGNYKGLLFVTYINNFTNDLKTYGDQNGEDLNGFSENIKGELDELWKLVNTESSLIFNIILNSYDQSKGGYLVTDKNNQEYICTKVNDLIDEVIDEKVDIAKVIREDINKNKKYYDKVKKSGNEVNNALTLLIQQLIEIKAQVYNSNYYNGKI